MSVLQEIVSWAQDLPPWEADAISRLLLKPTLTTEDLEDLFALLKAEHGIPDPKKRVPTKLASDIAPVPSQPSDQVQLKAIKNLVRVNAIAEAHTLPIAPTGLTVIYGDNGAGKSGYSRVLKKACRARDQGERILPNANRALGSAPAEADFEVLVSGAAKDHHWIDGKPAPAELSSIAIFDTRCARAYLDAEDDFSYVPYGLDVFESLAEVCRQLKTVVDAEYEQVAPDLSAFALLAGKTKVGTLIAGLSAKTTTGEIDALAVVTADEVARHASLDSSLKENNAKDKASRLNVLAQRITAIANSAEEQGPMVDSTVYENLKNLAENYYVARTTAARAAEKFTEGEHLLPGTGGEAWRALFEAARRFSIESHSNHEFPDLSAESPCPLCQQPLEEGAARLQKFEAFIMQDAEKAMRAKRTALLEEYSILIRCSLDLGLDDLTYGEVEALDKALADRSRAFEDEMKGRRDLMTAAYNAQSWPETPTDLVNPSVDLHTLASQVRAEAETFAKAADEKARAVLQAEFDELDVRMKLQKIRTSVIAAVGKLLHQSNLNACLGALKTNAISLKASEIAQKVVSKELADTLNAEFKLLGVGSLQVVLASRIDKGKPLHKLKLQLPQSRSPSDILSEGEQRAIAIGSFLAEVNLIGGKGGVIFDDPVSSLDHRRRELVARRLVAEGKKRQVIIFTHDIYFLRLLADEAEAQGVPIMSQALNRTPDGYGVADPELPFEGRKTTLRLTALKEQQAKIAKLRSAGDMKEFSRLTLDAYRDLRKAWEGAIEELLFCRVVLRFRKSIETTRLGAVSVEEDDSDDIEKSMTKCSNYVHDKAMEGGTAVPDPAELLADINELDKWRLKVDARSKALVKKREKAAAAAASASTTSPGAYSGDGERAFHLIVNGHVMRAAGVGVLR
jgi:energy-coupling factor transporter ATP-binding protein EcfA2